MSGIRALLADALMECLDGCGVDIVTPEVDVPRHLVDVLLSLPGVAIVDIEAAKQLSYEFWTEELHARADGFGIHPDWITGRVDELFRVLAATTVTEGKGGLSNL